MDAWVDRSAWIEFMARLTALERDRRGDATLESISPGELRLHISALDRFGRMGVEGRMVRYYHGAGTAHLQMLQFEFGAIGFDPSLLIGLVAELSTGPTG